MGEFGGEGGKACSKVENYRNVNSKDFPYDPQNTFKILYKRKANRILEIFPLITSRASPQIKVKEKIQEHEIQQFFISFLVISCHNLV